MKLSVLFWCIILSVSQKVYGHDAKATYLANEAVLVSKGEIKALFDPFFHQDFGTYQLVPKDMKQAIFKGQAPFDNISVIVISHAHDDHFAADEVLKYLRAFPDTKLVAPQQAVDQLMALDGAQAINSQITSINLAFNEAPKEFEVAGIQMDAVRIPHAGWPSRADVENMVYRVTFTEPEDAVTVMHLGDADPQDSHYLPYKAHWQKRVTDTAFPPYWFFFSAEGRDILSDILQVKHSIGVHVPVQVPKQLKSYDYFSTPGEQRPLRQPKSP